MRFEHNQNSSINAIVYYDYEYRRDSEIDGIMGSTEQHRVMLDVIDLGELDEELISELYDELETEAVKLDTDVNFDELKLFVSVPTNNQLFELPRTTK